MKTIKKDELFQNFKDFLKTKGIELQEGSYTRRMQQGCGLLADAVNVSQQALQRTKEEMDKRLDQMRQVIHEKTAPKASAGQAPPAGTTNQEPPEPPKAAPKKSAKSTKARGKGKGKK